MGNSITFVNAPQVTSVTPSFGFFGDAFVINGTNFGSVTSVRFQDVFQEEVEATFTINSDTEITGSVPMLDGTYSKHRLIVKNAAGQDEYCCFEPMIAIQLQETRRLIQYRYRQITDRYGINSTITHSPNKYQGHEVEYVQVKPVSASNTLEITCEMSLESSFWGGAVMALFKGNEDYPRKVWNYALLGDGMGTVAKLTYLSNATDQTLQTWRLRVGKPSNSYATVYINRSISAALPYAGYSSSFISVKEIEGVGIV